MSGATTPGTGAAIALSVLEACVGSPTWPLLESAGATVATGVEMALGAGSAGVALTAGTIWAAPASATGVASSRGADGSLAAGVEPESAAVVGGWSLGGIASFFLSLDFLRFLVDFSVAPVLLLLLLAAVVEVGGVAGGTTDDLGASVCGCCCERGLLLANDFWPAAGAAGVPREEEEVVAVVVAVAAGAAVFLRASRLVRVVISGLPLVGFDGGAGVRNEAGTKVSLTTTAGGWVGAGGAATAAAVAEVELASVVVVLLLLVLAAGRGLACST